jgi:ribose transport system ATP-binding protein
MFTVLRDGRVSGTGRVDDVDVSELVSMMVGRDVDELYPRSERQRGETVLEIDSFGGQDLPISATLQLHRGEVLGIAGLIGAGRTQMLRAIFGLDPVARGEVRIGGYSGAASPPQRWRQRVGFVSEDRAREGLAVSLSIADNLTMPRLDAWVRPGGQRDACQGWIDRLSIRCLSAGQSLDDLSGGNQQKVAIARLLHADVDVLLLDEPSRGIDVGAKAEIYQLIDELAAAGKAVLMVSSYLP